MNALLPVNHSDALEALRNEMIKEIKTYVPATGSIGFVSGGYSRGVDTNKEQLYMQGTSVKYYGHQHSGYNDRYDCDISALSTDVLSDILTELERE